MFDQIFERWDGNGYPSGLKGEAISLPARVTHFSHTVVLELSRRGAASARVMVQRRAGHELDPGLADLFLRGSPELLASVTCESVWGATLEAEPESQPWLSASRIDAIARSFAYFSDLKSPYMLGHCQGVAGPVEAGAQGLGPRDTEVTALRRAALLHNRPCFGWAPMVGASSS